MQLKTAGVAIKKQYRDKWVIVKKDAGARIESTLDFVFRHYVYADIGFIRTQITLHNKEEVISIIACRSFSKV